MISVQETTLDVNQAEFRDFDKTLFFLEGGSYSF